MDSVMKSIGQIENNKLPMIQNYLKLLKMNEPMASYGSGDYLNLFEVKSV